MPHLPTGTITFLFTDIEGSTLLWERAPDAMRAAMVRHDVLVEACITTHMGTVVRPCGEGDSRFAVFPLASDAVAAACALQQPKQLLLVVDNCEHLIGACAALADTLLRTSPQLRILATSREGLGIAGETTWRVPFLAVPDPQWLRASGADLVAALTPFEAVRLFIERVVAALPHFTVTNQNAPAVAQLCHRVDGIPLALELAAAWVKVLAVDQIVERLEDRFRLLTGGSGASVDRAPAGGVVAPIGDRTRQPAGNTAVGHGDGRHRAGGCNWEGRWDSSGSSDGIGRRDRSG